MVHGILLIKIDKRKEKQLLVTEKNWIKSLRILEDTLSSGDVPVLVTTQSGSGLNPRLETIAFISGEINCTSATSSENSGTIEMKKGTQNRAYACIHSKEPLNYSVRLSDSPNIQLKIPRTHNRFVTQENTFSPAGPSQELEIRYYGTESIELGYKLWEKFSPALDAVNFARNAFHFALPSREYFSFPVILQSDESRKEQEALEKRIKKYHCLNACVKLIKESLIDLKVDDFKDNLILTLISPEDSPELTRLHKTLRFETGSGDYRLSELNHPYRNLAVVRVESGTSPGEAFVYPYQENGARMHQVLKRAFSDDLVKKLFP